MASVVIVTYNGERFIRRLLDSLRAQTFRDFETVVVDNASADGTCAIIGREYPEVRLAKMERNLQFAAGNNVGYRLAAAPIVVLLNQDTWVEHGWLVALLAPLLRDGSEGVSCTHAPILNEGEQYARSSARFDPAGGKLATLSVAGRNCQSHAPFDPWLVFYGSGAALAVRKGAAGERLFDESYGAYGEDIALGWRLRVQGGKLLLVPEAHVHHALPLEGRDATPALVYIWERNRLFNLYIHYRTRTRWLLHPVFAADVIALAWRKPQRVGPEGAARAASSPSSEDKARRRALRHAVGRAMLEAIARNGALRQKHRALEALRRVPEVEVTRAMTARLVPFDEGVLGFLNRFSAAWCRAFGVETVESLGGGG